jgi:delta-aminolevulinic acid dehydratase/porphobilinogen synthase
LAVTGVNPGRARHAVRALLERPGLHVRDLTAPLLVLPDGAAPASLPGAVPLAAVADTVRRWADTGICGIKVFAFGDRCGVRGRLAREPDGESPSSR